MHWLHEEVIYDTPPAHLATYSLESPSALSCPLSLPLSDGMSRTGVFITTMAEVERVKVQGEVDIFQTVKAARSERPHMVSTPVSRGAGRSGLWGWVGGELGVGPHNRVNRVVWCSQQDNTL